MVTRRALRFPLLALGAVGLFWGIWVGLARMGAAPVLPPQSLMDHGALMVGGFLGTVISLERAVAHGRAWGYLGPLACAGRWPCTCSSSPHPACGSWSWAVR